MSVIAPGTAVPAFALTTEDGEKLTERDLLGHETLLVFYPYAFSDVCTDQLTLYEEVLDDLTARDVRLFAVSCDARHSQSAFRKQLAGSIPHLSDSEPKGVTCRAFGVLHPAGMPERALVLIGADAVVRWSYQAPSPGDLPGVNLLFDALAASS